MSGGTCSYCRRWAADGIVIALVLGDCGPGWRLVAHPACATAAGRRPVYDNQSGPAELKARGQPPAAQ